MHCLVIKTSALGDIVQTYPALRYLRRCCPKAHIGWVVERTYVDLVRAHPAVDACYSVDTQAWRRRPLSWSTWLDMREVCRELRQLEYDLVLDFQGNTKSALIASQVRSKYKVGFAAGYVSEKPNLWAMHRHILPSPGKNVRDDYIALVQAAIEGPPVEANDFLPVALELPDEQRAANVSLLQRMRIEESSAATALFFAGSSWRNKQLTEETLSAFLVATEKRLGIHWLLAWGSIEEKAAAERLRSHLQKGYCIERLSLPRLQHLMSLVDLVVSMDSLPLHLAATTGVPTYSFFGPSSASKYAPVGLQHAFFQASCPYGTSFDRRCPILRTCSTGLCLRGLSVQVIYEHFANWWCARKHLF